MKLLYKNKILISGIFPLKNYKVDGYIEKTGVFDNKMINTDDPEQIFYSAGHLLNSDKFGLLYGKIRDNFLNGNLHVLSSEDYTI